MMIMAVTLCAGVAMVWSGFRTMGSNGREAPLGKVQIWGCFLGHGVEQYAIEGGKMRADAYPLDSVLGEKQQWVVPVYQRHYEWDTGEDQQLPKLWQDLSDKAIERLEDRTPFPHYFGAIIYSEPANQPFGSVRRRLLVDGQQRITTFKLVLAAIREVARDNTVPPLLDVINAYLFNEQGGGMRDPGRDRFKLWPSSYDRELYQQIAERTPDDLRRLQSNFFYKNGRLIKGRAPNLLRAFWYLYEAISEFVKERQEDGASLESVLEALLAGFLSGFQIVVIQLDANDDAQEIFASLNGLGKPLTPFDLIRNDVFHRAAKMGEDDENLFDLRWKTFENPFWNEQVRQGRAKRARADHFIAHAVVAESAREVNVGKVATEYQHYARERAFPSVAEELDVLLAHAGTYQVMEDPEDRSPVGKISKVLRVWDLSTFHPFVFRVHGSQLDEGDESRLLKWLESYIVRRDICGLTSKNYNKVVIGMLRHFGSSSDAVGSFADYLSSLGGDASRMPTDAELAGAIARQPIYVSTTAARLRYILEQIEYGMRNKFDEVAVSTENLTVEHVMPRRWAEHWPLQNGHTAPCESVWVAISGGQDLSDEDKAMIEARGQAVDTLGNLTLVTEALNPSIGNGPWEKKKERLQRSLLALNRDVAAREYWNEEEIEKRGAQLAAVTNRLWPSGR